MRRAFALLAIAFIAAACGADTTATFNPDGSVSVGIKFLFPKSVMQGGNGMSVSGLSQSDIANSNKQLQQHYSGAKITTVTEGDESGALVTIPFKTEKDAFAFLTQPSKVSPSGGSSVGLNLGNTGGLFSSATHTNSGGADTYTFKTVAQTQPSPAAGTREVITNDELQSIFTLTFAITLPHVITSAPGALFTIDRKTAIWKLHWTRAETLTATTGQDAGLVASVTPAQGDWRLLIAVAFMAVAGGFLLGMLLTWRGLLTRSPSPPSAPAPPVQ